MLEPSVIIPVGLLAVAALLNLWKGIVPNWLVIVMLVAFPIFAVWTGMALGDLGWHTLAFVITFAVVIGLFAVGLMGGGAGKLIAATALWLPPASVLWFLLLAVGLGVAFLIAGHMVQASRGKAMATRFAGIVAMIGAAFLVLPVA